MRNHLLYILLIVIISLALSACQSENETPAPQTPAPQTPAPQTPAPQTPAPQTPAPQTPAPQTPAPQTPAPQTPAPQTPAPQTPAPQTPAPQTPAPQTPAPQTPAVEKSAAASTPQAVDLEITQQSLEHLYNDQESQITAQAPERITTETKKQQKTEISAGVLLDQERGSLLEGVDGAEVKISVPLD